MSRRVRRSFLALVALPGALGCAASEPAPVGATTAPEIADRTRVLTQIDAARAERGLPAVHPVADSGPLAAAEREIRRGASPDAAIRTALQRVVDGEESEASGWCLPTADVARIDLPSVLLEQAEVYVSMVAVRKPPGSEPPTLVVCLLVYEDGPEVPSTDG